MASVADYLTRHREDIIRRYNEECGKLPPAAGLTPEELTDTLPEYLGALAGISRQGRAEGLPAELKRRLERTHIRIRLRAGYREEEALNEYVILGRLIASTWEGAPPEQQPSPEDTQRLFEGLQSAMDGVVQGYTGYTLEDRQREKRFLRRLDALSSEALGEGTHLAPFEERLEPLLAVIQEALEADGVALFLVEEDGKSLPLISSTGLGAAPRGSYRTEVGAPSFVGQLAALDEPLQLMDASAPSVEVPEATRHSGLGTLLGVRIQPFGKLRGVLFLGVRAVRPFTPRDERYLETLVEYFSRILGEARLFERVRRAEARYRLATQALTAAIWEWNLRTDSVHWSEGILRMLGHRVETLGATSAGWTDHIHPEDRRRVEEGIHAVIDGGGTHWRDEYRFRHADGGWRVVTDAGVVERDARGTAVRMVGAMQDVTLQRQAEEARRESEVLLRLVVDNMPVLINFVDAQQRYVLNNRAYRDWFGVDPEAIKGKTVREVVGEENYARIRPTLERVLAGEQVEHETPFVFGAGRRGHVLGTYVPYRDSKGQVQGFITLVQDITERTVAERSLRERVHFEQQLIGIVGHDLRSPLQSILLSANALSRQEELDARAMRNVTRIRTAAERAERMIRDLLDFTQARLGGGIPLERKEVDVHALIREVVDEMEANFPEREVQVKLEGERQARLDRDRMAQVLTNLISNALKYSPEGSPVRVSAEGTPEALVLSVWNTGEPVPAERMPHIFKPMQRATHQQDKTGRSVGLGLFIVHHLVEAHGGTVRVSSSLEEGTVFTVRIPRLHAT